LPDFAYQAVALSRFETENNSKKNGTETELDTVGSAVLTVGRIRTRRSSRAWLDEHRIFVGLRGFLVAYDQRNSISAVAHVTYSRTDFN
jgi:hypothetical protein